MESMGHHRGTRAASGALGIAVSALLLFAAAGLEARQPKYVYASEALRVDAQLTVQFNAAGFTNMDVVRLIANGESLGEVRLDDDRQRASLHVQHGGRSIHARCRRVWPGNISYSVATCFANVDGAEVGELRTVHIRGIDERVARELQRQQRGQDPWARAASR